MVEGNDVPFDSREAANGSLASSSRAAAASASRSARRRRERREGGGGGGGGGSLRSTASAPLAVAPGGGRGTRVRRRVGGVAAVGDGRAPAGSNDGNDDDDDVDDGGGRPRRHAGPLPKVVSDLLLQTAFFGIDTTARLSRPTLDLTVNTLLPQVVAPLLAELFEHYVPARLRAWTRVLPTSTRNLWNLLRDTDAGRSLGKKVARLGEDVVDLAGSGAGRQCCVDATVALIRLLESLRTPEMRALLDQCAVGACRFVDVLGSGGAKQVWFDISEALWALIEVGSDRAMVTSLAEGCAQICFALENERDSLNRSKTRDGGSSIASKRRRERDRRQRGTYPPGRAVVSDEAGRDGFDEALRDGLNGGHDIQEEESREEFKDQVYADMDNVPVEDDGPPKRVIVPTNSSELREANFLFPNISVDDEENDDDGSVNPNVRSDDSESEITTEMEDLRCGEEPVNHDDARTQGSTSELPTKNRGGGNAIRYEQDDKVDCNACLRGQIHQPNGHPNDDGTASEMHDAFDESILQFYRRMNEA
ncbi:hypothetical protein ACHAW5_002069 [Stephanodiscus triporus]|uniref:Uncharacterized protein n=1 Tax=Stephanodiscus triporus TaxID=2934178 RepID=A0ABD3NXB9_9STRA